MHRCSIYNYNIPSYISLYFKDIEIVCILLKFATITIRNRQNNNKSNNIIKAICSSSQEHTIADALSRKRKNNKDNQRNSYKTITSEQGTEDFADTSYAYYTRADLAGFFTYSKFYTNCYEFRKFI